MSSRDLWEKVFLPPEEVKRRQRVRTRKSYIEWLELYSFLEQNPSKEAIMRTFYNVLDAHKAFNFRTMSDYALESLELLLKEKEENEKEKDEKKS